MAVFSLNITKRTPAFGETDTAERAEVCRLLQQAIQMIGSGRDPDDLRDASGERVGDYHFGADAKSSNTGHREAYRR